MYVYIYQAGLNIKTGHQTMSGMKSSYVRSKLLHSGHRVVLCEIKKIIRGRHLKTQKHWVSIGFPARFFFL